MNTQNRFHSTFYSGLSGLQLPVPQYLFPPPFENASRITYYSSLFNSIEINSSFYKIPQPATVTKWAGSVPEHFKFTFKLFREITHSKGLNFKENDIITFFQSINYVQNKKGCLLIQFPPSIGNEYTLQLNNLLSCISVWNSNNWKIAMEFRNKSWYTDSTLALLKHFNAALVIQDIPKSATPLVKHETDFIYIRFHGPTGNYRESYSEDFLMEYSTYVNEWIAEGKTVYMYFNNTMGDAIANLKTINRFLQLHNNLA